MSTRGTIATDNSDINDLRFMDKKSRTVRSGVFEITRLIFLMRNMLENCL